MPNGEIYVQVTASCGPSGKSKSVVVLVPRANIENYRSQKHDTKSDDQAVARSLAEPLARYAFTHRVIFSVYELSHSFFPAPPHEIENRPPNISQGGLKAWIVS